MKTSKEELLAHYATKEPRRLIQYDAFTDPDTWDSVVEPNSVFVSETCELMNAPWGVRVLADPKISKEELRKALDMIKSAI